MAFTYDAGMPSAPKDAQLKRVMKDAIREVLEERTDLLHAAVAEALEDVGLIRAMESASKRTVSERRIRRALSFEK